MMLNGVTPVPCVPCLSLCLCLYACACASTYTYTSLVCRCLQPGYPHYNGWQLRQVWVPLPPTTDFSMSEPQLRQGWLCLP